MAKCTQKGPAWDELDKRNLNQPRIPEKEDIFRAQEKIIACKTDLAHFPDASDREQSATQSVQTQLTILQNEADENRTRKIELDTGRHKATRESENYCVTKAGDIWDAEVANNVPITRMGIMIGNLEDLLIKKEYFVPKDPNNTIRKWLLKAAKEKNLIIPPEAQKSGR